MPFARALFAFLAMPGVVGVVMPWVIARGDPWRTGARPAGAALVLVGVTALLWCVRDFYVVGKGTLAPWSPPRRLVVVGLYRVVRNPMYLAVLALVAGTGWWQGSPLVVGYAALLALLFHLRVRFGEEPWLARTFPDTWRPYQQAVRRWVPRVRPWDGEGREF
jgi:protein-S-isoprenylcysteine O-methyltransferase Ste14